MTKSQLSFLFGKSLLWQEDKFSVPETVNEMIFRYPLF